MKLKCGSVYLAMFDCWAESCPRFLMLLTVYLGEPNPKLQQQRSENGSTHDDNSSDSNNCRKSDTKLRLTRRVRCAWEANIGVVSHGHTSCNTLPMNLKQVS